MALGSNRDYKTRERYARNALAWHAARMAELEAAGLPRLEASAKAYDELIERKREREARKRGPR